MKDLFAVLFVLMSLSIVMIFYIITIPVYFLFFGVAFVSMFIGRFWPSFRRKRNFVS